MNISDLNVLFIGDMSKTARASLWFEVIKDQVKTATPISHERLNDSGEKIVYRDLLTLARWKLGIPKDIMGINRKVREQVKKQAPDVLWVLKSPMIWPSTLRYVRKHCPQCKILFYSEDDMFARKNRTRFFDGCIPYFDVIFTTKSYNTHPEELPRLGARKVIFVDKAYHHLRHRPYPDQEGEAFGAPVCFIGTFEAPRAASMLYLAENGIPVRIWGNHWPDAWSDKHPNLTVEGQPLYGEDYSKAICASQINLAFLRKANRDQQTDRTMEIPACGAFMLTERTDEHLRLFEEGKEAEFFRANEELLTKVKSYLEQPELCHDIGQAGRQRCLKDGYDMSSRVATMLGNLFD